MIINDTSRKNHENTYKYCSEKVGFLRTVENILINRIRFKLKIMEGLLWQY